MRYDKKQLNVYRGVLKNKNLAKVLEEGLSAPVGSTKRKRAQKTLSVIKKTSMDGKGGPGPRSVPRVNVQLKPQTVDYSNFLILPPTPPIRVPIGENPPTPKPYVHDGQGYVPMGISTSPITTPTTPADPMGALRSAGSGLLAGATAVSRGASYLNPWAPVMNTVTAPFRSITSQTQQAPSLQTRTSSPMAFFTEPS